MYKTILVHLADDRGHMARLRLGIALAKRHQAHLLAVYIATPISMPAAITGRGASIAFISEATDMARQKAETVKQECAKTCDAEKVRWQWLIEEGDHLDILAEHSCYADIAIVSHSRAELLEDRVMFHVPEHLPLVTGCPVMILPEAGDVSPPGKNVLVAWKPTREALRATRDALPLLVHAENVTVLSVSAADENPPAAERAAAFLSRHGVKAEAYTDFDTGRYVGEAILSHARNMRVDLIVMGGYGHSRLREMVLGGVTRHVLNHMSVPMLMSH